MSQAFIAKPCFLGCFSLTKETIMVNYDRPPKSSDSQRHGGWHQTSSAWLFKKAAVAAGR
ncbi:hypothetical protein CEE69_15520 [Rhodopirellula bahusiensis]|uniref:Uncharacterized protein n=1 Tax=Rhodopirellula bahusiensis TaxID=2014065 RepID=A0A2G1W5W2_9BACT|nr:hypothetical protein CEE69_15520 [Rhodopirellula bahusiensis]